MIIFPDTNILVHFQPIENWIDEMESDTNLTIGICLATINELDKLKYSLNNNTIKRRVQQVVKKLGSEKSPGNKNLPLLLYTPNSLQEIISKKCLDKNDKDDVFIASVLKYIEESVGEKVKIVSNDLGVQLKCKAHQIEFITPPEKYLIQDDNPAEKEIKKLTRELNQFKNLQPKLKLQFENGEDHNQFDVEEPWLQYDEDIKEKLKEIQKKNPLLEADPVPIENRYALGLMDLYKKTPEKVATYNAALLEYYHDFEIYLHKTLSDFYKEKLTIILNIELINDGNTPAEHVDLYMHFPDGFELADKSDYRAEEKEPSPPNLSYYSLAPFDLSEYTNILHAPFMMPKVDFGGLSIKKTNSYDVNDDFKMIKHHHLAKIESLYITFDSFEEAKSFEISYKITAGNMSEISEGNLHVILNKIKDSDEI